MYYVYKEYIMTTVAQMIEWLSKQPQDGEERAVELAQVLQEQYNIEFAKH
jgi:hypothetical protein